MFNTTNLIKFGASVAGALLIFLLANWAATTAYQVGPGEHADEEHAAAQGYVIAPDAGTETAAAEEEAAPEVSFADVYASADAGKGEKVFAKCKACHKLEEGANATGPSLYGVVGKAVATEAGFAYSDAMLAHQGSDWTPELLDEWLTKPKDFAPGTKMTFAGLKKIEDRANLIAYLATIGG
ncbi:MAG: cytochrome c family protein [Maritimibacter sp.]|jgi:cytochrome c